jgi:hypothetical protein
MVLCPQYQMKFRVINFQVGKFLLEQFKNPLLLVFYNRYGCFRYIGTNNLRHSYLGGNVSFQVYLGFLESSIEQKKRLQDLI